jgi:hypothetical protein
MTKQEKITEFLSTPIEIGDDVCIRGLGSKDKINSWGMSKVTAIQGDKISYKEYGYREHTWVSPEDYKRSTHHIGDNPFKPYIRNDSYKIDIKQLIYRLGFDRDGASKMERYFNVDIPEVCFDPTIEVDGKEVEYQRGLVWSLNQKQLLIESIYNRMDIGKFVFRRRSFKWVENRIKSGKTGCTSFMDLVDGKQRANAILGFVNDDFSDLNGNYYSEFSTKAAHEFGNYSNLTYVELPEETTDDQTLETFLCINNTGVPMSAEHIEYVKSLRK